MFEGKICSYSRAFTTKVVTCLVSPPAVLMMTVFSILPYPQRWRQRGGSMPLLPFNNVLIASFQECQHCSPWP